MKADMVRINRVENGYVISARPEGQAPQSYAYTGHAVAKTIDEAVEEARKFLEGNKPRLLRGKVTS